MKKILFAFICFSAVTQIVGFELKEIFSLNDIEEVTPEQIAHTGRDSSCDPKKITASLLISTCYPATLLIFGNRFVASSDYVTPSKDKDSDFSVIVDCDKRKPAYLASYSPFDIRLVQITIHQPNNKKLKKNVSFQKGERIVYGPYIDRKMQMGMLLYLQESNSVSFTVKDPNNKSIEPAAVLGENS